MRTMTLLLAGAMLVAACGGGDGGSNSPPPANTIEVRNNQFVPSTLTVAPGTTVTFSWPSGSGPHNVTPWSGNTAAIPASPGLPDLLSGPRTFDVAFPDAGTFRFYCSSHGSSIAGAPPTGMAGTITVQ